MNTYLKMTLLCVLSIFSISVSHADETDELIQKRLKEYEHIQTKGSQLAQEFSKVTGCAMNPLGGICIMGAYTYFSTPADLRKNLPWHASFTFLAVMSTILGLLLLKEFSKVAIPKVLSTPLDAIEWLTEKPVTPFIAMATLMAQTKHGLSTEIQHLAGSFLCSNAYASTTALPETLLTTSSDYLTIAISCVAILIIFVIIWVVNQAFNFLIFLCPSNVIDLILTSIKTLIFATVLGLSLVSPYLGAGLSAIIFIICVMLFSIAFRITVFGYVATFDFVRFRIFRKTQPDIRSADKVLSFAGKGMKGVPRLSKGYIEKNQGRLVFTYRPWLIFGKRHIAIAAYEEGEKFQVVKGFITLGFDKLICQRNKAYEVNLAQFPPRYHGVEKELASFLGTNDIVDSKITRGFKGAIAWIRSFFFKPALA